MCSFLLLSDQESEASSLRAAACRWEEVAWRDESRPSSSRLQPRPPRGHPCVPPRLFFSVCECVFPVTIQLHI